MSEESRIIPDLKEAIIKPEKPKVLKASSENVSNEELRQLAGNLALLSFKSSEPHSNQELQLLMKSLVSQGNQIEAIEEGLRDDIEDVIGLVHGVNVLKASAIKDKAGVSLKEYFDSDFEGMVKMMKKGQLFILKVDGKAVSTIGYREARIPMPDGRKIYEIKKASTLPEYIRKGYFREIAVEVVKEIIDKEPDTIIAFATKSDAVKESCRKIPGWQCDGSIGLRKPIADALMHGCEDELRREMGEEGYEVFFFASKPIMP